MSDAVLGYGSLFQTESLDSPNDWVTADAEITDITLPSPSREVIDLSHESGPDDWTEAMPGKPRPGDMSIEFNFVPGGNGYNDFKLEYADKTVRRRRIVFPNGAVMEFSAFVSELGAAVPLDSQMKATVKLQLSGSIDPIA